MARTSNTPVPTLDLEHQLLNGGVRYVGGVDEVGRGALAGPVTVGICVVDALTSAIPDGLADSKLLSARRRESLAPEVERWSVAHALGWASSKEIDLYGIVAALRLAGERALSDLAVVPDVIILDGNFDWLTRADKVGGHDASSFSGEVIIRKKADQHCASVSAASIIAKVARDALMTNLHGSHPEFAWDSNKGYGAAVHTAALRQHGPTPFHRTSWNLTPGRVEGKSDSPTVG